MSRPIKFRAWDKQHHEWLGADAWYVRDSSSVLVIWPEVKKGLQVSVNIDTLGAERVEITQYTSLKDKNGVEIYEGDVVRVSEFKKLQLVSNISGMQFELNSLPSNDDWSPLKDSVLSSIEVIGNIYENPELLEANQ